MTDDEIKRLQREHGVLLRALYMLEKEFRRVYPIYYYAEPWAHNKNMALKHAQAVIAAVSESDDAPRTPA